MARAANGFPRRQCRIRAPAMARDHDDDNDDNARDHHDRDDD